MMGIILALLLGGAEKTRAQTKQRPPREDAYSTRPRIEERFDLVRSVQDKL